jgi:hypothetical protein
VVKCTKPYPCLHRAPKVYSYSRYGSVYYPYARYASVYTSYVGSVAYPYVVTADRNSSISITSSAEIGPSEDSASDGDGDSGAPENADSPVQAQRFLRLENDTGEPLTVYVQYRCLTGEGAWTWFPANPASSTDAVTTRLDPGQVMNVKDQGAAIAASRVRIWGTTATKKWLTYQSQDFWLVPEQDDQGRHCYVAPEMGTFTFSFGSAR